MKNRNLPIRSWLYKGLSLVLALTLISSFFIFYHSLSGSQWFNWSNINLLAFLLACLALISSWMVEGVRIYLIATGMGERISLKKIIGINLATTFSGNITPFYSGGVPTQIFLLYQNGIAPGKASAIVTLRVVASTLIFTVLAPFLLLFYRMKFSTGLMQQVTTIAIPVSFLITVLLIMLLTKPKTTRHLFNLVIRLVKSIKWLTRIGARFKPYVHKGLSELETFQKSLSAFSKGYHLYLVFFCSLLNWILFFSIAPLLIYALGVDAGTVFWESILFQFIMVFIVSYLPIPGGSGIMELSLYSVFVFIPLQLRAIFVLIWRFLSYHVATFIGGIILIRMINRRSPRPELPG